MTSVFHVANYSHPSGPVHPPTQLCQHPQTNPDFVREPLCSPAESTASLGELSFSLLMQEGPARTHARVHTRACAHMNTHRPVHTASLISFVLHPCSCFTSRAHYQCLRDKYRIWVIKRNLFFFFTYMCVYI